jgi:hypothetical protein
LKKIFLLMVFLLAACRSVPPTSDDFPLPPTMIVDFPTPVPATATLEPRLRPVTDQEMSEARDFFLVLLTRVVSGDSYGIAENVKYPITVNIDGPRSITTADEFVSYYDRIFNDTIIDVVTNTNEGDLIYLPGGIRLGHGEIWFNLYCTDPTCVDAEFLITQINN